MYGPYLDHFLLISSNSFILLVKKFLSFTRDAVIKKKSLEFPKGGGGYTPFPNFLEIVWFDQKFFLKN